MELSDAKKLIRKGEAERIEFKLKIKHPEKVIKELVAFANTNGGYLFIGVNDDGAINGTKYPEGEIFALNDAINNYCRPPLQFSYEIISLSEKKSIVVYDIPVAEKKPHWVTNIEDNISKQVYVRVADKSIKASRQVQEIITRRQKQRNIQFNFGDKEKWLMDYLDRKGQITLKEFKYNNKISTYQAARGLILMVLANVLDILPSDKEDLYKLK